MKNEEYVRKRPKKYYSQFSQNFAKLRSTVCKTAAKLKVHTKSKAFDWIILIYGVIRDFLYKTTCELSKDIRNILAMN